MEIIITKKKKEKENIKGKKESEVCLKQNKKGLILVQL